MNKCCLGCADRVIGCHSDCSRYLAAVRENQVEKSKRVEYYRQHDAWTEPRRKKRKPAGWIDGKVEDNG